MKRNLFIISVIFILALAFCSVSVYAKEKHKPIIPNLVGDWEITIETVCYEDIFDPLGEPVFYEFAGVLTIAVQEGRTFAGYIDAEEYKIKVTGAIDGVNIKMQRYGDNNRDFFTGRLLGRRNPRRFRGTANSFEEITLAFKPSICTSYMEANKIQ